MERRRPAISNKPPLPSLPYLLSDFFTGGNGGNEGACRVGGAPTLHVCISLSVSFLTKTLFPPSPVPAHGRGDHAPPKTLSRICPGSQILVIFFFIRIVPFELLDHGVALVVVFPWVAEDMIVPSLPARGGCGVIFDD